MGVTLWKEKRGWCGAIRQSGFLSTDFFPKECPSPGGSVSAVRPCGECPGLWPLSTKAPREVLLQGKGCSCIDWRGGRRAGCLFSEGCHHLALAAVAAQGWLMAFCELQVVHLLGLPLWGKN